MKKLIGFVLGLSLCCSALSAPTHYLKNQVSVKLDPPNSASGAFSYYWIDRDPTPTESVIIPGLLEPKQILFWKNTANGNLFLLVSATDDPEPILTWAQIQFVSK